MSSRNNIFGQRVPDSQNTNSEKMLSTIRLTVESGKNNLNEWPRVVELQTNVKKAVG